jgi:ABC-type Fe3+-hydroxamate transport system substrate-binding protein
MSQETYTYTMDAPVDHPPRTVVSLVPSMTESLFVLNLGDRLIGRTDYCIYPQDQVASVPTFGGTKDPDIARIIDLQPDLVLANYEENRKPDVEALRAAGIPVWVTFPRTVADVFVILWNIMYLFDETTMVPRIRLTEQIYDRFLNRAEAEEDELPRVFVPIWHDPLMTANQETYLHDILFVCGGKNVFAERQRQFPLKADLGEADPLPVDSPRVQGRDTRYPRISWDEVEAAQPDVILLPGEPYAFTEEHLPLFQKLDVPAAKNKRIHLVDGSWLTWHGTRVAYALDNLPTILRGDKPK